MSVTVDPTSEIRMLFALLRELDPSVIKRTKPATPADIDALEAAEGKPLPPDYREFLRLAGGKFPVDVHRRDLSVKSLLKYFNKTKRKLPATYFLIGLNTDAELDQDLYLVIPEPGAAALVMDAPTLRPGESFEHMLREMTWGPSWSRLAGYLFERYLFTDHLDRWPLTGLLVADARPKLDIEEVARELEDAGLDRVPEVSDDLSFLRSRPIAAVVRKVPDSPLRCHLCARERGDWQTLALRLRAKLGLTIAREPS